MPWEAIQYVTSGFTLCAFIVAVIAWAYKRYSQDQRLRIESARPEDRGQLVSQTLEGFNVDTSRLTKDQQYYIVVKQIGARIERFRLIASLVVVLAIIGALLSGYSISKAIGVGSKASGGDTKVTPPDGGKADLSSTNSPDPIHFSLVSALPNHLLEAKVTKRNTGQLDALHVRGFAIVEVYDGSKDRDSICKDLEDRLYGLKQSGQMPPEQTIPAGEVYKIDAAGRTISPDEAQAIENGTIGLYVGGFYTWSDKANHKFNWRYRKRLNEGLADTDCAGRPWNRSWTFD